MNAIKGRVGTRTSRWPFGRLGWSAIVLALVWTSGSRRTEGVAAQAVGAAASGPASKQSAVSIRAESGASNAADPHQQELVRRYGQQYLSGVAGPVVEKDSKVQDMPAEAGGSQEESLKQGLWLEEAKRDPAGAIPHYQRVLAEYDANRVGAATALFRLGECQRKVGQTNEAAMAYRRLLRDFSDQEALIKLATGILESWGLQESGARAIAIDPNTGQPVVGPGEVLDVDPNTGMLVSRPAAAVGGAGQASAGGSGSESLPRWRNLDTGELPRYQRELAFLERKNAAGDQESYQSALRLVFPEDAVMDRAEKGLRQIGAYLADHASSWSKTEAEHRRLTAELATARAELQQLERLAPRDPGASPSNSVQDGRNREPSAGTQAPSSSISRMRPVNPELDEKLSKCLRLEAELRRHSQSLAQRAHQQAMQAYYLQRLVERREELLVLARMRVRVLGEWGRSLQAGGGMAVKGWEGLLGLIRNTTNAVERSMLIKLTLEDGRLEQLRQDLSKVREQAADVEARGSGEKDSEGVESMREMLARAHAEFRAREEEVLRLVALQLEMRQANVQSGFGPAGVGLAPGSTAASGGASAGLLKA